MINEIHELKSHIEQLNEMLRGCHRRIEEQNEYIRQIEEERSRVNFNHGCLLAKIHLDQKTRNAASRN
jgi:chromosome segregation ATPase